MAEGHIEFTLSVCVCVCVPVSCPGHKLTVHNGIKNDLTQIIIMTGQCVTSNNHVARSKVKVTVRT